jgi:hypothetical protein
MPEPRLIHRASICLTFSMALVTSPAAAQSIAGTWRGEIPAAVRQENGEQVVIATVPATLVIQARGDSVFGTMVRGSATVQRPLRGLVRGDSVTLVAETKANVTANGEAHTLALLTTFRLRRSGDMLRGTTETMLDPDAKQTIVIPGIEQSPVPVTISRVAPPSGEAPQR